MVDADEIVKELQEPGQVVLVEMVEHFGDRILLPDGRLDRQAVADIVFGDKEQLEALGKIVHPRVQEELLGRVAALSETDEIVILDIPLLAESGWEGLVGTIVVDLRTGDRGRAAGHPPGVRRGRRPGPHRQPGVT